MPARRQLYRHSADTACGPYDYKPRTGAQFKSFDSRTCREGRDAGSVFSLTKSENGQSRALCTIMETVAGVFRSREMARTAAAELSSSGFRAEQVSLLYPGSTEQEIHSIPTSDTEQPGVGAAIGGVVGAAVGMAGGFELGVAATALIPGVGPVIAAGIAGAALLGVGGLAAGVELGGKPDAQDTEGIPADELYFYEDALRQGRSVLFAFAGDEKEKQRARNRHARSGSGERGRSA